MKKEHGQFYTTNANYILSGMTILPSCPIIEPFAGNGDLLSFIPPDRKVECFDIQPHALGVGHSQDDRKYVITQRDTLLFPLDYSNAFVITNPPYLSRNKSKNKTIYDLYKVNDLYKCFLSTLFLHPPLGGILILPLNFFCSIRKMDIELRKKFLSFFKIERLNIFEHQVFQDTTFSVCSFSFLTRDQPIPIEESEKISIFIYSKLEKKEYSMALTGSFFLFGGEVYSQIEDTLTKYKVSRVVSGMQPNTQIVASCIDGKENIHLSFVSKEECFIDETPLHSARTFCTLSIEPCLEEEEQKKLVQEWNEYIEEKRTMYHSLFLTSFREFARKRISFECVYNIVKFLLKTFPEKVFNE